MVVVQTYSHHQFDVRPSRHIQHVDHLVQPAALGAHSQKLVLEVSGPYMVRMSMGGSLHCLKESVLPSILVNMLATRHPKTSQVDRKYVSLQVGASVLKTAAQVSKLYIRSDYRLQLPSREVRFRVYVGARNNLVLACRRQNMVARLRAKSWVEKVGFLVAISR